jgi:hypothetical protein
MYANSIWPEDASGVSFRVALSLERIQYIAFIHVSENKLHPNISLLDGHEVYPCTVLVCALNTFSL